MSVEMVANSSSTQPITVCTTPSWSSTKTSPGAAAKALVVRVALAGEPAGEALGLIRGEPLLVAAQEDEAARVDVEDVKDLGLVRDVALEAEARAGVLQEDRVTQRAAGLARVALVLEQQADRELETGQPARRRARDLARQQTAENVLVEILVGFEHRQRQT